MICSIRTGNCLAPRRQRITEKECCCSSGGGWGKLCTGCPKPGSGKKSIHYVRIEKTFAHLVDRFVFTGYRRVREIVSRGRWSRRQRRGLKRVRVHDEPVRWRRMHQHGRILPVRMSDRICFGLDRQEVRGRKRVQKQRECVRQRNVRKSARWFRVYLRGWIRSWADPSK